MTAVPGLDSKLFSADTFSGDFRNKTIPAPRMRFPKRREPETLLKCRPARAAGPDPGNRLVINSPGRAITRESRDKDGISRHCRPEKGHAVFEEAARKRCRSACLSFFRNGRYRQVRSGERIR